MIRREALAFWFSSPVSLRWFFFFLFYLLRRRDHRGDSIAAASSHTRFGFRSGNGYTSLHVVDGDDVGLLEEAHELTWERLHVSFKFEDELLARRTAVPRFVLAVLLSVSSLFLFLFLSILASALRFCFALGHKPFRDCPLVLEL